MTGTGGAVPGAFTAREVQLVLLRRMADLQRPLVEQALHRLGSSRTELREANRRWNAVRFGRPGPLRHARFARALGRPVVDRAAVPGPPGGAVVRRSCWPLPLWPGLWLQVLVDAEDVIWHLGLVRAGGSAGPPLRRAADAVPWSCTLAECAAAFDEVTFHDLDLTGHELISCTAPDDAGRPGRWRMRSVWGLLQTVEAVPDGPAVPGGPGDGDQPRTIR